MKNTHRVIFDASGLGVTNKKKLVLRASYGTGNSAEGHFALDVRGLFWADVPRDDLVEFAKWVLETAEEGHQPIITQDTAGNLAIEMHIAGDLVIQG